MRKVIWIGSSRRDLRQFSDNVRNEIGFALYHAELDRPHVAIKILKGLGGGVLEIIANDPGGTYRLVYAVKFAGLLYVLHAFQKKSRSGGKVPVSDMELIARRLATAAWDFKLRSARREE